MRAHVYTTTTISPKRGRESFFEVKRPQSFFIMYIHTYSRIRSIRIVASLGQCGSSTHTFFSVNTYICAKLQCSSADTDIEREQSDASRGLCILLWRGVCVHEREPADMDATIERLYEQQQPHLTEIACSACSFFFFRCVGAFFISLALGVAHYAHHVYMVYSRTL